MALSSKDTDTEIREGSGEELMKKYRAQVPLGEVASRKKILGGLKTIK